MDLENYGLNKKKYLYWKNAGWKDGYTSMSDETPSPDERMRSYEVLDSLLETLLSGNVFPNIRFIVIAGIRHRDIVILLGENDTRTDDPNLDITCAGQMEGGFRLERGRLFAAYTGQRFEIVPNSGHNSDDMLNSSQARQWIFGNRTSDTTAYQETSD